MTDSRGDFPRVNLTKQRQPALAPPVPTTTLVPPPAGPRRGGGGRGSSGSRRGLWLLAGVVAVILIGVSTAALLARGDDPAAVPSSSTPLGSGEDTTVPDGELAPGVSADETTTEPTDEPSAEPVDSNAVNELDAIVASDSSASSALEGVWTAQLASSAPGESPTQFLSKYHVLKAQYPGALLIWSGDWPGSFGPSSLESWVVISGEEYAATRPLLEWCASEGWSDGQCWAKRLATSGDDPLLNTDRSPADDRNN